MAAVVGSTLKDSPLYCDGERVEESLEVTERYVRSRRMWRVPVVHILDSAVQVYDPENPKGSKFYFDVAGVKPYADGRSEYIELNTACGSCYFDNTCDTHSEIPEGMELCQTCVEALEFKMRRALEQQAPDRKSYNERTSKLLKEIKGS
jgi:hypothetical protein